MKFRFIDRMEQQPSGHSALVDDQGTLITYGRLLQEVHAVSAAVRPRSLVFCLCSNTVGALIGYLACHDSAAVALLLDGQIDARLLGSLIVRYQPAGLWVPEERAEEFSVYRKMIRKNGYALLKTGNPIYPIHDDLALLMTTSGSTGSPKLVRQSARNLLSNAAAIAEYLELDASERPITTLPMHYTYGLSVIHSHLMTGGTVLLTQRSVLEPAFWDFFNREGATSLSGVPATYNILKRTGFFERQLPSLRYFTQAGGKLSPAMHETCARYTKERSVRFYAMYGQTEATARMAYLPWQKSMDKCGSIGIPIPGGTFTLLDEQKREIQKAGETGELVYRGQNVTLGYAAHPEDLAKGDEWNGVLHTGDLAYRDREGYYYIAGRKKRFLKMSGSRVNLDECEQIVKEAFPECDCACCGTDDELKAFVTLDPERLEEARRVLCGLLGVPLSSVRVLHVDRMPRSSSGKILYPELEVRI